MNKEQELSYVNTILTLLSNVNLKNVPLTKGMAGTKNILKRRFIMIKNRKKISKSARITSVIMTVVLLLTTVCASGVFANTPNSDNGTIVIGENSYKTDIIHIENVRHTNTDSYFIPLRDVFEILGATVEYNVERVNVPTVYETKASLYPFPQYAWPGIENYVTSEELNYIYGATTGTNTNMPIIKITLDNYEWFCQIGCEMYSEINAETLFDWAPPVIMVNDNTAYMPIRALATILGGLDSVKWDPEIEDSYYEGVVSFDAEKLEIKIDNNI